MTDALHTGNWLLIGVILGLLVAVALSTTTRKP